MFLTLIHGGKIKQNSKDYTFLRNGDLVLRRGRSAESFVVYLFDNNRDYSHIGVVVIENQVPYIIHVVPDRPGLVRKDSPEAFLSYENASHFKIIRSDFQPLKLDFVASSAMSFYTRHLSFDNKYDLSTDNELYCTELVIKAFKSSNINFPDISPQKIQVLLGTFAVIMPSSFLENSHFTTIQSW